MSRGRTWLRRATLATLWMGAVAGLVSCQTLFNDSVRIGANEYLIVGSKEGFMHYAPAIWHLKDGHIVRVTIVEK